MALSTHHHNEKKRLGHGRLHTPSHVTIRILVRDKPPDVVGVGGIALTPQKTLIYEEANESFAAPS